MEFERARTRSQVRKTNVVICTRPEGYFEWRHFFLDDLWNNGI